MPSGLENLEGSRFILRYEYPWGGIASNAAPEDIQPNQLVSSDGIFIRNGRLCSTNFYAFDPTYYRHSLDGSALYMHGTTGIQAIYTVGQSLCAIDTVCDTFLYDFTNKMWVPDQSMGIQGFTPAYTCSQMINGIIYIFDYNNSYQYVYVPGQSMTPAQQMDGSYQNFVAGKYCMTVDQYLIVCNTNMNAYTNPDGVYVPAAAAANQYNWSKPGGYTTFSPYADPTLTEGWNQIAGVQKEITGCFAMSNVGYILHDQGLTQLTPTGSAGGQWSGILPFIATDLWTGKDGMGCTMPETLSVYGIIAFWVNNNDVYMFSAGAAPTAVSGSARRAIFRDLNKFKFTDSRYFDVHGSIINVGVDNQTPELVYNLYITYESPANTVPIQMIIWSFVMASQTWTRHVVNVTEMMRKLTNNPEYAGVTSYLLEDATIDETFKFPSYSEGGVNFFISSIYGGMIFNVVDPSSDIGDSFFLFQYINTEGLTTITDLPPVTNLTFRTEEFQLDRMPTIRGVILRAAGYGTLHIVVGGQVFSDVEVDSQTGTKIYRSFGIHTNIAPNVNINSTNFNGYITKVHAFGTYAEGEPI